MKLQHLGRCAVLALVLAAGAATAAPERSDPPIAQSYKLPISTPLDQGDSDLCWVYATLSMLETNYLVRHPGSHILLSRAAVQRESMLDRFEREISGGPTYLEDGGIAVDALRLIRDNGLVGVRDFHDVVDSDPVFASVQRRLQRLRGAETKQKALDAALDHDLGPAPRIGRLDGRALTAAEFAKAVVGDEVWTEYDVARNAAPHVGPSDDPDARPGTRVHYVGLATAIRLIHDSLARGEAVVWGRDDNHALLIYGADYDAEGRPLAYWVKDSFAPYAYRAPAEEIHRRLTDVTVAAPPASELTAERK